MTRKTTEKTPKGPVIFVRLPPKSATKLKARLETAAERHHRTVNGQVIAILEEWLEHNG